MKPTINKLRIILTYAVKHMQQESMLTGKGRTVAVPTGEIHICELVVTKDGMEPSPYTFCGKTRAEIGELTKDADKRPGLPMCPTCEIKWKAHPDSPWSTWERNNGRPTP